MQPRASDAVDAHVGSRVRLRRTLMGLSQTNLADKLGLTFQQVQKYERGHNRIGAGRLFKVSQVLDVPVSFFYDDMGEEAARTAQIPIRRDMDNTDPNQMSKRETLELVRAYYRIKDTKVRKAIFELVKATGPRDDED